MRSGLGLLLTALVGALVLAVSPAAMADESTYQLATINWDSCSGFAIENVAAVINTCVDLPAGVEPLNGFYAAASNGAIVFSDARQSQFADGGPIWIATPNGPTGVIDSSPYDFSPSISYDGSKVVFARFDPATNSSDIYSVNSDGSDLQLVVSGQGKNYLRLPSISPDGSAIAYWCGPAVNGDTTSQGCGPLTDGSYRSNGVMRVTIDGNDPRMIVIGPGADMEPVGPTSLSWSPDSQWLAMDGLLSIDLGNNESTTQRQLFEYRADGSDLFNNLDPTRQITQATAPSIPILAQFSPDGSQLLYMDFVDGSGNQGNFSYLIGVDGGNVHQVFLNPDTTCSGGSCNPPSWGMFIPTATPTAPRALVDMTHVTVPSVQALSVASATSTLESEHLSLGTVTYGYSDTVAKNSVLSQDPSAGAVAHRTTKAGPPVNLVVSEGTAPKRVCVVPKVTGQTLHSAKHAIAAGHCAVGRITRVLSRKVRKGHVISQEPRAGTKLDQGVKIALTVSRGKKP